MRYERKFRTNAVYPAQVVAMIKSHSAGFFEAYPPRKVNNIYFDTIDLDNWVENLDGVRDRVKMRLRWYGDLMGRVDNPVLEFKIKHGFLGTKRHFKAPSFVVDRSLSRIAIRKALQGIDLPPEFDLRARMSDMTIMNCYRRTYYESMDRRFRLTMDTDLKFYNVARLSNNLLASSGQGGEIILELKYDRDADANAHRITNEFPLRYSRNSKYAIGVEHVCAW